MEEIKITAINEIKINPDRTAVIKYSQSADLTSAEITFKGKDKVTEAFYNKFQENIEGLIASIPILGEDKYNLTMNIIKFVFNEDKNIENVKYAAKYSINDEDDKADIVTPLLSMDEKEEKHQRLLNEVIRLAKSYVNGDTSTKQIKFITQ
jgi:hypothetical protein